MKAKANEIGAVGELAADVRSAICPFFDYPRKANLTGVTLAPAALKLVRSIEKHLGLDDEFYFDNFDIDDRIEIGKVHNYKFMLERFAPFAVIPVISIDRSQDHLDAVRDLKQSGKIRSDVVSFRVTHDNFEDYRLIQDDIADELAPVFAAFQSIDLIFDCRLCTGTDAAALAMQISKFSEEFCAEYDVRRVVLTGSSIPASVRDITKVQTERVIHRNELEIYYAARKLHKHARLTFGDYTTVSPLYSDLDLAPQILQNVMTAKVTYTFSDSHYVIRGRGLKTNGRQQYFAMAQRLCSKPFFRGAGFSAGDGYFAQKSHGQGSNCGPNTVIKPAVNAHISYMVRSGILSGLAAR